MAYITEYGTLMRLESDYEYVLQSLGQDLQLAMAQGSKGYLYEEDAEELAKLGEDIAKENIKQLYEGSIERDTGRLYENMYGYNVGNRLQWFNSATDDRNRKYAGHIEYGFRHIHSKAFIGPFPFLRPMLQTMQEITGQVMKNNAIEALTKAQFSGPFGEGDIKMHVGTGIGGFKGSATRGLISNNIKHRGGYVGTKGLKNYQNKEMFWKRSAQEYESKQWGLNSRKNKSK